MTNPTPQPEQMLDLISRQQRSIESQLGGIVPAISLSWGLAWLIGFSALWAIDGLGLATGAGVATFIACLAIAIGISTWLGVRTGRGIRSTPANAFTGTVYGVTWSAGSLAIGVFGGGLGYNGMSPELANYFYPTAYVLFAGVMYLAAGAIWHAVPAVVTGGLLILVAIIAPFIPAPWHYLFFAVAGGGVFLGLSVVTLRWTRRVRSLAVIQ